MELFAQLLPGQAKGFHAVNNLRLLNPMKVGAQVGGGIPR
jgi:hypothetical protein